MTCVWAHTIGQISAIDTSPGAVADNSAKPPFAASTARPLFRQSLEFFAIGAWPTNVARFAWWTRLRWRRDGASRFGVGLRSTAVFPLNRFVNFLSVNGNRLRCVDPESHFVASNIHNRDDNVVADHDAFVSMSRKDQHGALFHFLECGPGCKSERHPSEKRRVLRLRSAAIISTKGSIGQSTLKMTTIG